MHSVSTNFSVQFACFPKVFVIKFQTNENGFQLMLFFNQALDVKSLFQMAMDKTLWLILCATSTYICSCFFQEMKFFPWPKPWWSRMPGLTSWASPKRFTITGECGLYFHWFDSGLQFLFTQKKHGKVFTWCSRDQYLISYICLLPAIVQKLKYLSCVPR